MMMTHSFKPALPLNCNNVYWAAPLTILLSVAALVISAKIQVPTTPVPITLQTAVILILPVLFGWQMALTCLLTYFTAGIAGLPVFAYGSIAGPAYFLGTTGGYLIGFALSILAMGAILKFLKPSLVNLFVIMLFCHALVLACGAAWLAYGVPSLGLENAITLGIAPFITGAILKSAFTAAFARYITKT